MVRYELVPFKGKTVILVHWNHCSFVFRYAYEKESKALSISENLEENFGKFKDGNDSEVRDIAANYLPWFDGQNLNMSDVPNKNGNYILFRN